MRRAMATLALALAAAPAAAWAYPIPPETLWGLTEKADLVAVASVERFHDGVRYPKTFKAALPLVEEKAQDGARRDHGQPWVRLKIESVVAGPAVAAVDVRTFAGMICPAPPNFQADRKMLVFLRRDKWSWSVVSLSYGTLYPTDAERPLFVALVQKAAALQAGGRVRPEDRVEWLVSAAEHRATRWHGLYALGRELDEHSFYDSAPPERLPSLTVSQQDRLAKAFMAEPSTDATLPVTLKLLGKMKDPRLDATLIGAFETSLAHGDNSPGELLGVLRLLLLRFAPEGRVKALLPEVKGDEGPSVTQLEKAWREARETLKLPAGTRVDPVEGRVPGVGQDTPF
ncbi:MAG: hypothetical protein QM765_46020 [Myxococcales bacterium]